MNNKLVFISGPYSANTRLGVEANVTIAREAALWCVEHRIFYFCPHLNSLFFEQWKPEVPTSFYYAMDEEILSRCDVIVLVGKWWESKGCQAELEFAALSKKRIFYFDTEQQEILNWYREEKP